MSIPREQQEVAAFLKGSVGAEPVETHISAVFVGPDTAWKLKKAVRLPFLDFTTVEARRRFLQPELELNRRSAQVIYRDVAAIVRESDGTLSLTTDPGGRLPLDWVLRMAPIPKDAFLDAVAARDGLTATLLDALGDCVASITRAWRRFPPGTVPEPCETSPRETGSRPSRPGCPAPRFTLVRPDC